jgi:hypothetical protein
MVLIARQAGTIDARCGIEATVLGRGDNCSRLAIFQTQAKCQAAAFAYPLPCLPDMTGRRLHPTVIVTL